MKFLIYFLLVVVTLGCGKSKIETQYKSGNLFESFEINKDKQKDGTFMAYFENGNLKEKSQFKNGIQTGLRTLYYDSGKIEIEEFYAADGVLNGSYKVYYPDGTIKLEKLYENNVIKGSIKVYYPSGKLKEEVTMINNEENGPFKEYYENGVLHWKGSYRNGNNEFGLLEEFDSTGAIIKKMRCDTQAICRTFWKPSMPEIKTDSKL